LKKFSAIEDLLRVMAKLRSPKGCPWDREQTHMSLRRHAIEEVYELIDAIGRCSLRREQTLSEVARDARDGCWYFIRLIQLPFTTK